jgi:hypothetical protein
MQTIDIEVAGEADKVEIDWLKLHAMVGGVDCLIYEDAFDLRTEAMGLAGLYSRDPWPAGDRKKVIPYSIAGGLLIVVPSDKPQYVFRFWDSVRAMIVSGHHFTADVLLGRFPLEVRIGDQVARFESPRVPGLRSEDVVEQIADAGWNLSPGVSLLSPDSSAYVA